MTQMTKNKMIDALRGIDPDTDLTVAILEQLSSNGSVRSRPCGNRVYYELELLIEDLNALFELSGNTLPRIRTLHNAYEYATEQNMGFSRRTVYGIGEAEGIPKLRLGSRTYIVLELFDGEGVDKLRSHMFKTPHIEDESEISGYTILYR